MATRMKSRAEPSADSPSESRAKPAAESAFGLPKRPPVKRYRVVSEKGVRSGATGIVVPFGVRATFGTRARGPARGTISGFPHRGYS